MNENASESNNLRKQLETAINAYADARVINNEMLVNYSISQLEVVMSLIFTKSPEDK